MDIRESDEQLAFREEVRSWIAQAMPPEMKRRADDGAEFDQEEVMQWHRILFEKGWIAPHWPEEVGGTGWDIARRHIFGEELIRANAPQLSPFGLGMVGPLLIQFGNDEQKQRFLPKILSGRGGLVSGLLGAQRRLGPGQRSAAARRSTTATTTCSTARRPGPPTRSTPTGSSCWHAHQIQDGKQAGGHLLPAGRREETPRASP